MRLLIVTTGLSVGGAETVLVRLLRAIRKSAQGEILVVSIIPLRGLAGVLCAEGFSVKSLEVSSLKTLIFGFGRFLRLLFGFRPTVIQGWMYHGCLFASIGKLFCWPAKVFWSVHHASFDPKINSRKTLWLVKLLSWLSLFPLVNKIVFCGPKSRKIHVERGFSKKRSVVIPNGISVQEFSPNVVGGNELRQMFGVRIRGEEILLGIIASWQPIKGYEVFLQGAKDLLDRGWKIRFLLCGRDLVKENEKLRAMIERLGLREHCVLLGQRSDVPDVMRACDILALTSHGESLPMVLLEGMASGVPCFSSDVGDCGFALQRDERLFPAGNAEAFAEKVEMFLKKSDGIRFLEIEEDIERARRDFSIEKVADLFLEMYKKR